MANIKLNNNEYPIPDSKLSAPTADFIAHLRTIAGTGLKVVIGGVEYGIDSSKVAGAVESFEDYLVEASKPKSSEGLSFVSNNDGTCYVTNGTCTDTEIVILAISPAGDRVTGIASEGFWAYNVDIVSVAIPNTVVEIGSYAFWECYNLTTITYDGTIEQWQAINKASDWDGDGDTGDYTIYCTNGEIAKDGMVTYYKIESKGLEFRSNGDGTCYVSGIGTCTDTDIVIPDEYDGKPVTSIGSSAFYGCDSLESVEIPDSVTSIGDGAFGECYELSNVRYNGTVAQWLAIPKDNDYMTGSAWDYDTGEYTVYCSDGEITKRGAVTYYPSTASEGLAYHWDEYEGYACYVSGVGTCTDTDIIIPDEYDGYGVTIIGSSAFYNCTGLTSIVIPDSVTSIRSSAFSGCTGLTSVVIPDSVTSIGEWAFRGCTGLTSIVIGNSVTSIGSSSFVGCTNLTSIFYTGTTKQWEEIDGTSQLDGLTVCCSDGYVRI